MNRGIHADSEFPRNKTNRPPTIEIVNESTKVFLNLRGLYTRPVPMLASTLLTEADA